MKKSQIFIAEFIGTFFLIFCGCGAVVVTSQTSGLPGHIGISMVFGLIVMTMIYAVGNISGAHFNPAVTIGFVVAGRMKIKSIPIYLAGQISAAISASLILVLLFPDAADYGATVFSGTVWQGFAAEVVFSFLLMYVILNVSTGHQEKGIMAGVAIGATVALLALFGGPVTGASMNPARSIGPALVSGSKALGQLWLYCIAPVIGTVLAAPFCKMVQRDQCCSIEEN